MDHIANLTELRRALVDQRVGDTSIEFDMCEWVTTIGECGTAACIGGTAQMVMQRETGCDPSLSKTDIHKWMGGNFDIGGLFFCSGDDGIYKAVTLVDAIAVVDSLIAGNRFTNWVEFGYGRKEPKLSDEPKLTDDPAAFKEPKA
jgi:hypothetical protein